MKLVNLVRQRKFALLAVTTIIAGLLLVTACGAQGEPTPTPTPPPVAIATATPVPTATQPAPTDTPEPASATPTATNTATLTATATSAPPPTAPPTSTPTVTPVPLMQASEAKVIYHGAEVVEGIGRYRSGVEPWMDLLVRLEDGQWYGPERQEDDIEALPLPDGYGWETEGNFSSLPNGEAWWTGPGLVGEARLIGPGGSQIYTLQLKVEFY